MVCEHGSSEDQGSWMGGPGWVGKKNAKGEAAMTRFCWGCRLKQWVWFKEGDIG